MTKNLSLSLIAILVGVVLLLQTGLGVFIFYLKTGLTFAGVAEYYVPVEGTAKSFIGLLEIHLSHIFAMALLSFLFGHLLPYISCRGRNTLTWFLMLLPAVFLISPFLAVAIDRRISYLSLVSLLLYEVTLFYIIFLMVTSFRAAARNGESSG